jgi:hypothetical protein
MTTEQALTDSELAQILDAAMHEPGPTVSLAICDVGLIDQAVCDRVFTAWASALTEHDVVLPVAHENTKLFAVIRMRTRSGVEAEMLADRLIARAADPVRIGDTLHRVRIHVGVAVATETDSGGGLVARSFDALHRSYGVEGRNWARALTNSSSYP